MSEKVAEPQVYGRSVELASVYSSLPLSEATIERNELTNAMEYRAPAGRAFRLTGQFVEVPDFNATNTITYPPITSRETLVLEYADMFQRFLRMHYGNEDVAIQALYEDVYEDMFYGQDLSAGPPTFFVGRWLTIHATASRTEIHIKGNVEAWSETVLREVRFPSSDNNYEVVTEYAEVPFGNINWQRPVAEGVYGQCSVELVDYIEEVPTLVTEKADVTDGIWEPSEPLTARGMVDFYTMSFPVSEEEKEAWIARVRTDYREKGIPLGDDPLHGLRIITGEDALCLDVLVAIVEGREPRLITPQPSNNRASRIIVPKIK